MLLKANIKKLKLKYKRASDVLNVKVEKFVKWAKWQR